MTATLPDRLAPYVLQASVEPFVERSISALEAFAASDLASRAHAMITDPLSRSTPLGRGSNRTVYALGDVEGQHYVVKIGGHQEAQQFELGFFAYASGAFVHLNPVQFAFLVRRGNTMAMVTEDLTAGGTRTLRSLTDDFSSATCSNPQEAQQLQNNYFFAQTNLTSLVACSDDSLTLCSYATRYTEPGSFFASTGFAVFDGLYCESARMGDANQLYFLRRHFAPLNETPGLDRLVLKLD